jgi:acyl-CoA synthetase (NDP forming)
LAKLSSRQVLHKSDIGGVRLNLNTAEEVREAFRTIMACVYRGRTAADLEALRDVLLRVSRLAEALPEIAELDLNPVMTLAPGKGCRIVDARIRVAA